MEDNANYPYKDLWNHPVSRTIPVLAHPGMAAAMRKMTEGAELEAKVCNQFRPLSAFSVSLLPNKACL